MPTLFNFNVDDGLVLHLDLLIICLLMADELSEAASLHGPCKRWHTSSVHMLQAPPGLELPGYGCSANLFFSLQLPSLEARPAT